MPYRLADDARLQEARRERHQRHVQRRFVREQSMRHLAMLAERFTVVAREHDERASAGAAIEDRSKERRESGVGRSAFAQIRRIRKARRERFRRNVRKVRLIEVHPCEPRRGLRGGVDPRESSSHRVGTPPFRHPKSVPFDAFPVPIVVDVEPAPEPEPHVERKGADERARAISERLEPRRQRVDVGWKPEAGILANAVPERIPAGEDVGVRRQRDDVLRVRV